MNPTSFDDVYQRYQIELERELRKRVPPAEGMLSSFYGMLRYHLGWTDESFQPVISRGGKRLRPILCLAAGEDAGANYQRALPAAAALEIVHNYSLIHDDIEDQSEQRRHRRTVWKIWGEAQAINAGDGLFTLATLAALDLQASGVDPTTALEVNRLLQRTCLELCEGQHLDMSFEDARQVTVDMYFQMIGRKTANLIATSAQIGALIGTGDLAQSTTYREFGYSLGLAFQIQDDILGIWGAADQTGKGATDIYQRKKTLPIVFTMDNANASDRTTLLDIYSCAALDDHQAAQVLAILGRTSAREFAEAEAERHYRAAKALLERSRFRRHRVGDLEAIADFLIARGS